MNQDMIWQNVRYLLLFGGGIFVGKGYFTADQLTGAVAAIGTLFTFGWGIYVKYGTKAVPAATAARSDVPTVSAATGAVQ